MSSSHPNQPGFGQQQGQNYPNSSAGQWNHNGQAPQPIPPFAPEGTFLTPQGRCQGVEATWGSPASSRANASVGVR